MEASLSPADKKKNGKFSAADGGVQGRNTVNLRENELTYISRPLEVGVETLNDRRYACRKV